MIKRASLPANIQDRLSTLGQAIERGGGVVFAYLFGGAALERLGPLSDVDIAVYLEDEVDPVEGRLEAVGTGRGSVRGCECAPSEWTARGPRRSVRGS